MAYKLSAVGNFGTGALGEVTNPVGQLNSYANVTAMNPGSITIGTAANGIYETFAVGTEILLHISAVATGSPDLKKLGNYMVAKITAVSGSVLSIDKDPSELCKNTELANFIVQAVTIANFKTLTLSSGNVSPLAYNVTNKYGGIIAIRCSNQINFSGGGINTVDKGIPTANASLRPLTVQETEMTTTGKTTGWENHITASQLLLNAGDGAVFLVAKASAIASTASRIGSTAAGTVGYPYAVGDNSPSEVLGGSSIVWVSESISGFMPAIISKSKGTGAGYGRCYIATNTILPQDELLYAKDVLSNPNKPISIGIEDFGTGELGDVTITSNTQINSYANVTGINPTGQILSLGTASAGAYGKFAVGKEILLHVTGCLATETTYLGRYYLAKILAVDGNYVTINKNIPVIDLAKYVVQAITVPHFNNLTVKTKISAKAYDEINKYGGILAMKVKDTLDITSYYAGVLVENAGLPLGSSLRPAIALSNADAAAILPMSQGHGIVVTIAKNLKVSKSSRIGASYSGANYVGNGGIGGTRGGSDATYGNNGDSGRVIAGGDGGISYGWKGKGALTYYGISGGDCNFNGGKGGPAGATILLVAQTIYAFSLDFISTGGDGGKGGTTSSSTIYGANGANGGAGYGGGGGGNGYYNGGGSGGGGGGTSGTAFIFVNTLVTPDYTGVVI